MIARRTFGKGLAAVLITLDPQTSAIAKFFSQNQAQSTTSYSGALNNPILQERWVKDTLRKYGVDSLFGEVIIVTPENAGKYAHEYNRNEKVGPNSAELVTFYTVGSSEDIGTERTPSPKLYVPIEAFKATEGDLTALIVYHEANHAKVARKGFGFISMDYFRHRSNPQKFSLSMFNTVYELEGHKHLIEKGANIMSPAGLEESYRHYMGHYIRLWRYGENLKDEITEMLKVRFFQSWMRNSNSLWVYEQGPDRLIKYGGKVEIPFLYSETVDGKPLFYIQFKFKRALGIETIKLPLPKGIILTK